MGDDLDAAGWQLTTGQAGCVPDMAECLPSEQLARDVLVARVRDWAAAERDFPDGAAGHAAFVGLAVRCAREPVPFTCTAGGMTVSLQRCPRPHPHEPELH